MCNNCAFLMMKKILITGSSSFTAFHLINFLINENESFEIYGIDLKPTKSIKYFKIDLLQFTDVFNIINKIRPDFIFHLVGLGKSESLEEFCKLNLFTVNNVLESIYKSQLYDTRILLTSSAAVYGFNSKKNIKENVSPSPINFYGTSKLAMEYLASQYYKNFDLRINIVRPFNIIGIRQPDSFVIPTILNQLIKIKRKEVDDKLYIGDINTERDFIDIQDVVKAYWCVINQDSSGEIYNIGSGKCYQISSILDISMKILNVWPKIIVDKNKIVKNQITNISANISKIKNIGFLPDKSITESLNDMINYYINN